MELYLQIGLMFLLTVCNICNCFNESSIKLVATVESVNESDIPLEVSGVAMPPKHLANTAFAVNWSHPLLESTGFIVNMSDIPLVDTAVPVKNHDTGFPVHLESNGTHISLPLPRGPASNDTNLVRPPDVSHTQNTDLPFPLIMSCHRCIPPLKTGADLYLGMTQWNSLVCGLSVCNHHLQEWGCLRRSCEECHCDPECVHYGDCCPDTFQTRAPQVPAEELSCFSQQFIESTKIVSKRYKMVSDCRDRSDKFDTMACLNPNPMGLEENRPVYSRATQLHYRNLHCARCHGVDDGISWDVKPFCETYADFTRVRSQEELLQTLRDEESCAVHYIPPRTSPLRECRIQGNIVRTCNATGAWIPGNFQSEIEKACSLYSQPITFNETNYNNIFCAHCNGEQLSALQHCSYPISEPNVVPFSMLLDVRSAATEELLSRDGLTCAGDHLYDPNIDACRPFMCPQGKFPENHQCTSVFKSAHGLGYIVHFALTPKDRQFVIFRNSRQLFVDISMFTKESLSRLSAQLQILNVNLTYVSHNRTSFAEVYSIDVQFAILVGTDVPIQEADRLMSDLVSRPFWWYEPFSPKPVYFDITWLPDVSSDRLDGLEYIRDVVNTEPYEVLSWRIFYSRQYLNNVPNLFLNNASVYIHVSGLLMCKSIELNTTEVLVNDSRTITVKYTGQTLKEGEFLWNGDKVQICTNFTGQRTASESSSRRPFDQAEVSLTLVCTSLSLCGLVITLIIYLILPSLRTLPARNNIFLFINLFLAQLLFLTGSGAKVSTPVCRTFAIIIHYFWLSTFCWKVVCGFHMYRLFINPLRALRYTRLLLKYILFAQFIPCVIIALVVGVNLAASGMKRFGYAERPNLCFLSGTLDVGLGFVTPVCLAVLMNVVFFTRVVLVLRNRPKIQRHTSKSDVKESVLYFKMSLILGFTWVLGFLALIVNDIGLWYVFTVVNASVGVFVFMAFGLKNVSLSSLLRGFGNKDPISSKTYETVEGTPKSTENGKYSPKHSLSDSVCSTPVKYNGKEESALS